MKTTAASNHRAFEAMSPLRLRARGFFTFLLSSLLTGAALADNLLVNPSFEANSGHALPIGWTYYSPPPPPNYFGNYWIEGAVPAQAGALYWKQWGALYLEPPTNNVAGIYQDFSSAPGSTYQASGWLHTRASDLLGPDCRTWLEVLFLDENGDPLALYKSEDFYGATVADMWLQHEVTQVCDLSSPIPSGDPYFTTYAVTGAVSQLVAPINTTTVRYRFAYLQAGNQGGSCYLDDAVLDQVGGPIPPVIGDLLPLNMIFVNPADGISFTATSPSGFNIDDNDIRLLVNGEDVSADLVITGSAAAKEVAYYGLASNMTYTASISVTDAFGFSASTETYFETMWVGVPPVVYLWEAEDFDFSNGQYFNHPDLCSSSGNPNCYYGTVGVEGVDEHKVGGGNNHLYRPDDAVSIGISGDLLRPNLHAAGRADYRIDPFLGDEWLNYTRDWTNGTYWVFARVATEVGFSGALTLSTVNPDSSTTDLGVFTVDSGRGWTSYDNVPLTDTNGNYANVTLNGKTTLRVTSGGNLLPNFFMLAAAELDRPILSNLYPTGKRPFEYTNALSFTVATVGATFPAGGIRVVLNGEDVSQALEITGSDSTKNVVYPSLQPNATHTALITITNSLGHGIVVTNFFDTFSQDNYMVEAEDFDYDGGQFVTDWLPGDYIFLGATAGIDFEHSPMDGELYPYRLSGIPQEIAHDYLRQSFLDWGATDYHLAWFGANDWANYTRVYPTNHFHLYARSGGFGTYSMELAEVISGAGTVAQLTRSLGHWTAAGRNNQTHEWVPLVEPGSGTPAEVNLGGPATLRLTTTTGNCHPSYFMLVPVAGVSLSATIEGNVVLISFPTLPDLNYRILYRDSLATGDWVLLESVPGDGSAKEVSDPVTAATRFYKLVAP
jgi:hypothetical protein